MTSPGSPQLPKKIDFYIPVLKSLSDGNEKTVEEIYQNVIKEMALNQDALNVESVHKGKSMVKYNMEWVLTSLKKKNLIVIPERSMRKITEYGLEVLNSGMDPQEINGLKENTEPTDQIVSTPECTFFEYLENLGLNFSTESVEDFLLSLKAKQFLILSGGTGTGKTRLAKAYGEYISHYESKKIDFEVTIGKGGDNNGFTLSKDVFFDNLPPSANKYSGSYDFVIGKVEGKSKIELAPRFWFDKNDPNVDLAKKELEELSKTQKKAKLSIIMPADTNSKSYLVVPVGSNWTDNRQILGYHNAITGTYSHTPSLDFMVRSNAHEAYPYMLILDEMNLSHVERYFSDIISSMESKEPILLDTTEDDDLPKSIVLGDNLFIAGTVNMDETTYMFSPKVLDRANVLEFEPISISSYVSQNEQTEPRGDVEFLQDCMSGLECRTLNGRDIAKIMLEIEGNNEIIDSIIKDLDSIQNIMSDMKLPFGFRTFDEIMRFMYVAWIYEGRGTFSNWQRYFDAQIKQKILPKIHGNSAIAIPLKNLQLFCSKEGYLRSASKLAKMDSVLDSQRYVSFNC